MQFATYRAGKNTGASHRLLASSSRVCKQWLPCARRLLYRSVTLTSLDVKLSRTLSRCAHLRLLIRELSVHAPEIFGHIKDVDNLLGWISLIPGDATSRFRAISIVVDAAAQGEPIARLVVDAPALRFVDNLRLTGPIPTAGRLLQLTEAVTHLALVEVPVDTSFPPLCGLRTLSLKGINFTPSLDTLLSSLDVLESLELFYKEHDKVDHILRLVSQHSEFLQSLTISPWTGRIPSLHLLLRLEVLRVRVSKPEPHIVDLPHRIRELHILQTQRPLFSNESKAENAVLKHVALRPGGLKVIRLGEGVRVGFQVKQMLHDAGLRVVDA